MIFPNEIFENIISFSHPIVIATFGLVSRDLYFIANKIQFSPNNTNSVKSNHLLSLWYHLIQWNNHNRKLFDFNSDFFTFPSRQGTFKIYCNQKHICVEMFEYCKVFKRAVGHINHCVSFFMINDTMYIVLRGDFINLNSKLDILRIVHSNLVPVKKRVSYFARNFNHNTILSQLKIHQTVQLKMKLLSYHFRKNLTPYFLSTVQAIVVHKNFIVCCESFLNRPRFYHIDTLTWQKSEIKQNDSLPLDYHVYIQSCENLTNLACTVHPVVYSIARNPHSILLFSPLDGRPECVCDIQVFKHPQSWMFFINDPEHYVLDTSGEFYKVLS